MNSKAAKMRDMLERKLCRVLSADTLASLKVIDTVEELPWGMYAHMAMSESGKSPALYDREGGAVYLIAEHLTSGAVLQEALGHELRHLGIGRYARMLSDRMGGDVTVAAARVNGSLDALYMAHQQEVEALAAPGAPYHAVYDGLAPDARRRYLAEEFFAMNRALYGTERWFDAVLAAVHDFLVAVLNQLGLAPHGARLGYQSAYRQLEAVVDMALQEPLYTAMGAASDQQQSMADVAAPTAVA